MDTGRERASKYFDRLSSKEHGTAEQMAYWTMTLEVKPKKIAQAERRRDQLKVRMVSFTRQGGRLCRQLCAAFRADGADVQAWGKKEYAQENGLLPLQESIYRWAEKQFSRADALVFIGAAGIAVRACAPHLRGKDRDPAVLVLDERGLFVIPLLSGHIGGANRLAERTAAVTGGQAVLTTATDVNRIFAVDSWAVEHGCALPETEKIKDISSALLEGKTIGFFSDFPIQGDLPEGLMSCQSGMLGVCITVYANKNPFSQTLHLYPRCITVGIGCRKGIEPEMLEKQVLSALQEAGISLYAVCGAATIDRKAQELAILAFCQKYALPLQTFTAQELMRVPGEFTASSFVQQTVGVDNVCERAAVCGSGGNLILQKTAAGGVTVAAAQNNWRVLFEDTNGIH